jgi:hypothetical protein
MRPAAPEPEASIDDILAQFGSDDPALTTGSIEPSDEASEASGTEQPSDVDAVLEAEQPALEGDN